MEKVDLDRYEITGRLGAGADYEVRAAVDRETGRQVAIKRPVPQAISRDQHYAIEERTEKILQAYQEIGNSTPLNLDIISPSRGMPRARSSTMTWYSWPNSSPKKPSWTARSV